MRSVLSVGNKSTELTARRLFMIYGIKGWRRHIKKVSGKPDFVFSKEGVVVFIDGCFWHGCKKHLRMPKTNKKYWQLKIAANIARDEKVNKALRRAGWKVLRVWEHKVKNNQTWLNALKKYLSANNDEI